MPSSLSEAGDLGGPREIGGEDTSSRGRGGGDFVGVAFFFAAVFIGDSPAGVGGSWAEGPEARLPSLIPKKFECTWSKLKLLRKGEK